MYRTQLAKEDPYRRPSPLKGRPAEVKAKASLPAQHGTSSPAWAASRHGLGPVAVAGNAPEFCRFSA